MEVGSLVSTQAADEAGESALDGFGLEDQGEIPKVNGTASDKVAFQQQCQNYHREKWLTLSQILDIMESSRDGSIEETRQKLRVLDVGTGDGKTLAYLHSRGYPWCNLLLCYPGKLCFFCLLFGAHKLAYPSFSVTSLISGWAFQPKICETRSFWRTNFPLIQAVLYHPTGWAMWSSWFVVKRGCRCCKAENSMLHLMGRWV